MMFKIVSLFPAFLMATAMPTQKIPPGLQNRLAPGLQEVNQFEQNLPCTLYNQVVEYEDGNDGSEWFCAVFGVDAKNAGNGQSHFAMVEIEGMQHVLGAKPDIESGRTTLFAKGAILSNHKLHIVGSNALTFGRANKPVGQAEIRRRKLSASVGDLSILVVRVSTPDSSLTKTTAEISGDVFGTAGTNDIINLKSLVEGCSNNVATINPGSGTGSACVDDQAAIFNVPRDDPGITYNCDFFNDYMFSTPGDLCGAYGTSTQVDDPNETANTQCCICGGGQQVAFDNNVVNGVMDLQLTINASGNDKSQLEAAAVSALQNLFYVDDMSQVFDNTMICLPRGSFSNGDTSKTNWLAYAYVGGSISVYNGDRWCANEVTQLHELGHNFGLEHASEGSVEYGDLTGAMGSTSGATDDESYGNRMCFNGAHSWQLGWYTSYNLEINPLTTNFVGSLVGVDRVPNVLTGENVVVKLTNSLQDYYIMLNHAVGVNDGSTEARNQVTITTLSTASFSKSFLVRKMSQGASATFTNWAGTQDSVTVYVTSIDTAVGTGKALVEVWKGAFGDRPAPPATQTPSPTSGPTSEPTSAPTRLPTDAPTSGPTPMPPPTDGPTSRPTDGPASGPTLGPTPTPPPTDGPTNGPTSGPTPTPPPTDAPTSGPTSRPTSGPTDSPTASPPPTPEPTPNPTPAPTPQPTKKRNGNGGTGSGNGRGNNKIRRRVL